MTATVQLAALAWYEAGASVLPAQRGKRPVGDWKDYQTERIVWREPEDFGEHDGLGIVTGYGGFEMLEVEGGFPDDRLTRMANRLADEGLFARLATYWEITPSGGHHWVYRVEGEQEGSQKLARDASGKTLIETRGKYGWTIMAPSGGSIHEEIPEGQWGVVAGVPGEVPTFTEEEIERIYDICREFNEYVPPVIEHREPTPAATDGSVSPGQDYEARSTWEEVLTPLGWTRTPGRSGDYWTRPGKRFGISASITPAGNLYVFSSSAAPLESEQSYTKFGVYAAYEHGGDWSAAARALGQAGYGTRREPVRLVVLPGGVGGTPTPTEGSSALQAAPVATTVPLSLTDDGNARLLVSQISDRLSFVPEREEWLAWSGSRWVPQAGRSAAIQEFRLLMRGMDTRGDDAAAKHKIRSLGWKAIDNAVKLAANDPDIHVHAEDLDAEPMALNTPDGVLDLSTGVLTPPTPAGRHTRITGCGVDFNARPERFLRFLSETFSNASDPAAMIEFIQRLAGYSATGKVTHHVLPFLHGVGRNGKSVLLELLQLVLGSYAGTAPPDLLLATGKEDHAAQADLSGQRLVVCNEVPPTAKFHEQRAKSLTGGDRVKARFLYRNYFEFTPTHHLWLAGNHQPQVPSGGKAFWDRMRLVPFNYVVPDEEQIQGLAQILFKEEGPAILAWIVEGARKQIGGLAEPAEVHVATHVYAAEEDSLGRFVADECEITGNRLDVEAKQAVWKRWEQWCARTGEKTGTSTLFGREIKTRFRLGDGSRDSNRIKVYTGLRLKTPTVQIEDDTQYPQQERFSE